jgi:hypothetical protein
MLAGKVGNDPLLILSALGIVAQVLRRLAIGAQDAILPHNTAQRKAYRA